MVWSLFALALLILGWVIFKLIPKLRKLLRPRPEDIVATCPHCGLSYQGTRRYCMSCGGQIWDEILPDDHE